MAAMLTLDKEGTLSILYSEVRALTPHDGDIQSLALLMGARLLVGDTERVAARAARAAVKQARAMLAVHAAQDSPTEDVWTTAVTHKGKGNKDGMGRLTGGGLSALTSPGADARWNVTTADLARTIMGCLDGTAHAAIWRAACSAMLSHTFEGKGRRPTLVGILAVSKGLPRTGSKAWALRRQTEHAASAAAPIVGAIVAEYLGTGRTRAVWTEETLGALLLSLARVAALPAITDRDVALPRLGVITERVTDTRTVTHERRIAGARDYVLPRRWHDSIEHVKPSLFDERTLADLDWAYAGDVHYHSPEQVLSEAREVTVTAPREASHTYPVDMPHVDDKGAVDVKEVITSHLGTRAVCSHDLERAVCTHVADTPKGSKVKHDETCTHVLACWTEARGESALRHMGEDESKASDVVRTHEARFDGEEYGTPSQSPSVADYYTQQVPSGKQPAPRKNKSSGAMGATVPAGRHSSV